MRQGETVLHGRFTITAPMVDEGPGAYFAVHDTLTATDATLRVLLLHGSVETGGLVRLRHDLRRVAASPHPYILRVLDCDVTAETLLLATEPRGPSLRQMLAARRLSLAEALTYALHIAGALGFMHTHGVTHGRLTPATVVIRDATARLADVGLCQVAAAFADPWPGDLAARPSYRPPEALHDMFPTPAMDAYHFGALLCEMLTGTPPPLAPAPQPPLAAPPMLTQLIVRCLQPNPAQRPHEMSEIITALKALKRSLDGKGSVDTPPPTEVLASYSPPSANDEQPTMHLARAADVPPLPTGWGTLTTDGVPTPAALPIAPARPSRRRLGWANGPPTVRLKSLALGKKLGLTGGILGVLLALFVATNGALLRIAHAAPPPTDAVVLRAGVTTLAPRATPYRVTETLVVGTGRTLRVAPGTTLLFAPGTALIIAGGTLEAHGTVAAPTTFTATGDVGQSGASPAAPWGGIELRTAPDGTPARAVLDGITLRAAGDGQSAAIVCHAGMLTLINSTQSDSLGVGVQTEANCWGEVAHTTFARDGGAAARVASASLHFHDNAFAGLTVSLP